MNILKLAIPILCITLIQQPLVFAHIGSSLSSSSSAASPPSSSCPSTPFESGSIDVKFFSGSLDCFSSSSSSSLPSIQVHRYNPSTYLLRQNKCINSEAPFLYLLFSDLSVLLIDAGATFSAKLFPLRDTVEELILEYLTPLNRSRSTLELIVAHTHAHSDHVSGDGQFTNQPHTTIVGHSAKQVADFFGLPPAFDQPILYSLGTNRPLFVIPIPGHENSSISLYDCSTHLLFTGDSVYPGRLSISDMPTQVTSMQRLNSFIHDNSLPVKYILGSHIDMSDTPRVDYPAGSVYQPNEHTLQFNSTDVLEELTTALTKMQQIGIPDDEVHNDFIISPTPSQLSPLRYKPGGRVSGHGMVIVRTDQTTNQVLLSHIPMFRQPHDFQLILSATATVSSFSSTATPLPIPTPTLTTYTLDPQTFSLNDLIESRLSGFEADLYQGNSEDGGKLISKVTVDVKEILSVNRLHNNTVEGFPELTYWSYPTAAQISPAVVDSSLLLSSTSFVDSELVQLFFIHQIRKSPDFDSHLRVIIDPSTCTIGLNGSPANSTLVQSLLDRPQTQWSFPNLANEMNSRLHETQAALGQILDDPNDTTCLVKVMSEYWCVVGPDFSDSCH